MGAETEGENPDDTGRDQRTGRVSSDDGTAPTARKAARRVVKVLLLVLVVQFLVVPQFAGARRALEIVQDIQILPLLGAVGLQLLAYLAHSQLVRALLPPGTRPPLRSVVRIELAGRAVSHVIPAGTAAGAALSFRLLQRCGVRGADAGFATATQGVGAALVLHVMTWTALAVSIPLRGFHRLYAVAALLGVVLVGSTVVFVLLATRGEQRVVRVGRRIAERLPLLDPHQTGDVLRRLAERVRQLTGDRGALVRVGGYGGTHWLCDAGSLWLFLAAYGEHVPVDVLLVAFGVSAMLATIPISPRGLGIVEAALITLLVTAGHPRAEVVLGVISYRLVSFWALIPLGAMAYVSLEVTLRGGSPRTALAAVVERAHAEADEAIDWVRRHGPGDHRD